MGKKRKLGHGPARPHKALQHTGRDAGPQRHANAPKRTPPSSSSSSSSSAAASAAAPPPFLPFDPDEHAILLVGEGDLSFAAALVDHHACQHVVATVLEPSPAALAAKYPQAAANAARVEAAGGTVRYGVDATRLQQLRLPERRDEEGGWPEQVETAERTEKTEKTGKAGKAAAARRFDRILFNFPHVGGKSTDVNRQVRYNQELLVAFFRSARAALAPGGAIVVTLFEGEPYTLWNIRDLARHTDLQVERSFRFSFAAYPGYHHARTLGVVRRGGGSRQDGDKEEDGGDGDGGDDNDNDNDDDDGQDGQGGKRSKHSSNPISTTAWRGEDRAARSYIFVRKEDAAPPPGHVQARPPPQQKQKHKQKRKRSGDSSDDDDS